MKESKAAIAVANEVLATLGNNQIPNIEKIVKGKGYSKNTARAGIVQKTKSYQSVIQPFVQKLIEERERAIDAMRGKISKAKYRDLTDAIDKLTKNVQLLTGGATSNLAIGVKKLTDDELQNLAEGS